MTTRPDLLAFFGYTKLWLDLGIVDEPLLRRQYAEFQSSEDKNHEHYRNGAFRLFLDRTRRVPNEIVDAIFTLEDAGPDECDLRVNRIIDVVASGILSDAQLDSLPRRHPEVSTPPIAKRYRREVLCRRISLQGIVDNFEAIKSAEDSTLEESLLARDDLKREHLQWLAEHGHNKAVRNQARQLLQSRRFRNSNL